MGTTWVFCYTTRRDKQANDPNNTARRHTIAQVSVIGTICITIALALQCSD